MLSLITQPPTQFNQVRDGDRTYEPQSIFFSCECVCVFLLSLFPLWLCASAEGCNKAANYELDKCQWAIGLGAQQPSQPHYI